MKKKKVMKPLTPMITLRLLLIVPWTKAIFPLPILQQKFHPNIQIGAQITKIKMRTNPLQEVLPGPKGTVPYKKKFLIKEFLIKQYSVVKFWGQNQMEVDLFSNMYFLTFPVGLWIPIFFSNLNYNCFNLLDLRNFHGQAFCYQKLFRPFIV